MRKLSPDEAALWARVTATIRPLSRQPLEIETSSQPSSPAQASRPARQVLQRSRPSKLPPSHRNATLDGGWDRRLGAGRIEPDRVLDLHGYTLDRAWVAIDAFLERGVAAGDRVLLLITGHERKGDPPVPRGRIRAAVHDWLAVSRHATQIAAVRPAHRRHGGGGSLYIILRRHRATSTLS